MVFGYAGRTGNWGTNTLLLLTTGFCGGFTTMSAFAYENINLMRTGAYTAVLAYITATVSLGILAAWLGLELTR
jgi:CrcB protein